MNGIWINPRSNPFHLPSFFGKLVVSLFSFLRQDVMNGIWVSLFSLRLRQDVMNGIWVNWMISLFAAGQDQHQLPSGTHQIHCGRGGGMKY